MTKLSDRVSKMMDHPKTQQMINKAKGAARKPENREKLERMSSRITGKARKPDTHAAHGQAAPHPSGASQSDQSQRD